MNDKKYTKLKDLVGDEFTVEKVWGFKWKMWLPAENRMHVADTYEDGHRKMWGVDTDKGELDVSDWQFGNMLASVFQGDSAELVGKTFSVKSNGKEGKEIRYFINPVYKKQVAQKPTRQVKEPTFVDIEPDDEPVDLSAIPF